MADQLVAKLRARPRPGNGRRSPLGGGVAANGSLPPGGGRAVRAEGDPIKEVNREL